jgi:hypothetical protein
MRAQWITLDQAPINGAVPLWELATSQKLNDWGQYYSSYADINAGQIQYYVDQSQAEPFFTPVFANTTNQVGYLYQDPMGAIKPHYNRDPLECQNPIGAPTRSNWQGSLSFIEDTGNQREDIISLQMAKMNQQRYMPRYVN